MPVTHHIENNICIVSVESEPNLGDDTITWDFIKELSEKQSVDAVLLDLEKTAFLNSSGIGTLITLYKTLEQQQIPFALCHLSQKNQILFNMTQIEEFLTIYPTKAEALSVLKKY